MFTIALRATTPVRLTILASGVVLALVMWMSLRWVIALPASIILIAVFFLAAAACKIVVSSDGEEFFTVSAPLWSRRIALRDIEEIRTQSDDGLNRGWINWFVTSTPGSHPGIRLNVGGGHAVVITMPTESVTIVCPEAELADEIATKLRKARVAVTD